ncbi:putative Replication factor C subunit 2 [Blattamonas nauphoetae]|uniref:histone acetyltransferase n=1 Tax=Blattamonas nauphoetae TaxID=2049346 RepID=A0ABQ9XM04_9EUKA|nr:putative Replication factor C subunit 2 [Blattamonas nauphoetae]
MTSPFLQQIFTNAITHPANLEEALSDPYSFLLEVMTSIANAYSIYNHDRTPPLGNDPQSNIRSLLNEFLDILFYNQSTLQELESSEKGDALQGILVQLFTGFSSFPQSLSKKRSKPDLPITGTPRAPDKHKHDYLIRAELKGAMSICILALIAAQSVQFATAVMGLLPIYPASWESILKKQFESRNNSEQLYRQSVVCFFQSIIIHNTPSMIKNLFQHTQTTLFWKRITNDSDPTLVQILSIIESSFVDLDTNSATALIRIQSEDDKIIPIPSVLDEWSTQCPDWLQKSVLSHRFLVPFASLFGSSEKLQGKLRKRLLRDYALVIWTMLHLTKFITQHKDTKGETVKIRLPFHISKSISDSPSMAAFVSFLHSTHFSVDPILNSIVIHYLCSFPVLCASFLGATNSATSSTLLSAINSNKLDIHFLSSSSFATNLISYIRIGQTDVHRSTKLLSLLFRTELTSQTPDADIVFPVYSKAFITKALGGSEYLQMLSLSFVSGILSILIRHSQLLQAQSEEDQRSFPFLRIVRLCLPHIEILFKLRMETTQAKNDSSSSNRIVASSVSSLVTSILCQIGLVAPSFVSEPRIELNKLSNGLSLEWARKATPALLFYTLELLGSPSIWRTRPDAWFPLNFSAKNVKMKDEGEKTRRGPDGEEYSNALLTAITFSNCTSLHQIISHNGSVPLVNLFRILASTHHHNSHGTLNTFIHDAKKRVAKAKKIKQKEIDWDQTQPDAVASTLHSLSSNIAYSILKSTGLFVDDSFSLVQLITAVAGCESTEANRALHPSPAQDDLALFVTATISTCVENVTTFGHFLSTSSIPYPPPVENVREEDSIVFGRYPSLSHLLSFLTLLLTPTDFTNLLSIPLNSTQSRSTEERWASLFSFSSKLWLTSANTRNAPLQFADLLARFTAQRAESILENESTKREFTEKAQREKEAKAAARGSEEHTPAKPIKQLKPPTSTISLKTTNPSVTLKVNSEVPESIRNELVSLYNGLLQLHHEKTIPRLFTQQNSTSLLEHFEDLARTALTNPEKAEDVVPVLSIAMKNVKMLNRRGQLQIALFSTNEPTSIHVLNLIASTAALSKKISASPTTQLLWSFIQTVTKASLDQLINLPSDHPLFDRPVWEPLVNYHFHTAEQMALQIASVPVPNHEALATSEMEMLRTSTLQSESVWEMFECCAIVGFSIFNSTQSFINNPSDDSPALPLIQNVLQTLTKALKEKETPFLTSLYAHIVSNLHTQLQSQQNQMTVPIANRFLSLFIDCITNSELSSLIDPLRPLLTFFQTFLTGTHSEELSTFRALFTAKSTLRTLPQFILKQLEKPTALNQTEVVFSEKLKKKQKEPFKTVLSFHSSSPLVQAYLRKHRTPTILQSMLHRLMLNVTLNDVAGDTTHFDVVHPETLDEKDAPAALLSSLEEQPEEAPFDSHLFDLLISQLFCLVISVEEHQFSGFSKKSIKKLVDRFSEKASNLSRVNLDKISSKHKKPSTDKPIKQTGHEFTQIVVETFICLLNFREQSSHEKKPFSDLLNNITPVISGFCFIVFNGFLAFMDHTDIHFLSAYRRLCSEIAPTLVVFMKDCWIDLIDSMNTFDLKTANEKDKNHLNHVIDNVSTLSWIVLSSLNQEEDDLGQFQAFINPLTTLLSETLLPPLLSFCVGFPFSTSKTLNFSLDAYKSSTLQSIHSSITDSFFPLLDHLFGMNITPKKKVKPTIHSKRLSICLKEVSNVASALERRLGPQPSSPTPILTFLATLLGPHGLTDLPLCESIRETSARQLVRYSIGSTPSLLLLYSTTRTSSKLQSPFDSSITHATLLTRLHSFAQIVHSYYDASFSPKSILLKSLLTSFESFTPSFSIFHTSHPFGSMMNEQTLPSEIHQPHFEQPTAEWMMERFLFWISLNSETITIGTYPKLLKFAQDKQRGAGGGGRGAQNQSVGQGVLSVLSPPLVNAQNDLFFNNITQHWIRFSKMKVQSLTVVEGLNAHNEQQALHNTVFHLVSPARIEQTINRIHLVNQKSTFAPTVVPISGTIHSLIATRQKKFTKDEQAVPPHVISSFDHRSSDDAADCYDLGVLLPILHTQIDAALSPMLWAVHDFALKYPVPPPDAPTSKYSSPVLYPSSFLFSVSKYLTALCSTKILSLLVSALSLDSPFIRSIALSTLSIVLEAMTFLREVSLPKKKDILKTMESTSGKRKHSRPRLQSEEDPLPPPKQAPPMLSITSAVNGRTLASFMTPLTVPPTLSVPENVFFFVPSYLPQSVQSSSSHSSVLLELHRQKLCLPFSLLSVLKNSIILPELTTNRLKIPDPSPTTFIHVPPRAHPRITTLFSDSLGICLTPANPLFHNIVSTALSQSSQSGQTIHRSVYQALSSPPSVSAKAQLHRKGKKDAESDTQLVRMRWGFSFIRRLLQLETESTNQPDLCSCSLCRAGYPNPDLPLRPSRQILLNSKVFQTMYSLCMPSSIPLTTPYTHSSNLVQSSGWITPSSVVDPVFSLISTFLENHGLEANILSNKTDFLGWVNAMVGWVTASATASSDQSLPTAFPVQLSLQITKLLTVYGRSLSQTYFTISASKDEGAESDDEDSSSDSDSESENSESENSESSESSSESSTSEDPKTTQSKKKKKNASENGDSSSTSSNDDSESSSSSSSDSDSDSDSSSDSSSSDDSDSSSSDDSESDSSEDEKSNRTSKPDRNKLTIQPSQFSSHMMTVSTFLPSLITAAHHFSGSPSFSSATDPSTTTPLSAVTFSLLCDTVQSSPNSHCVTCEILSHLSTMISSVPLINFVSQLSVLTFLTMQITQFFSSSDLESLPQLNSDTLLILFKTLLSLLNEQTPACSLHLSRPSLSQLQSSEFRSAFNYDVVGNQAAIDRLKVCIRDGTIPNIILSGPPGTGKTTCVLCIARTLLGDQYKEAVLELNASDERGIDVVRNKIKMFAQKKVTLPAGRPKIIILDEVDSMTDGAQQALRRIMEIYSGTTRFALACNNSSQVIEPIQSRCAILRFTRLSDKDILKRLCVVAEAEKVPADNAGMGALIFTAQGDMRQAINNMQSTFYGFGKIDAESVFKVCDQPHPEIVKKIVEHCIDGQINQALELSNFLLGKGYSGLDVVSTLFYLIPRLGIEEEVKFCLIREVSEAQLVLLDGAEDSVQLSGLLARMCAIALSIFRDDSPLELSELQKKMIVKCYCSLEGQFLEAEIEDIREGEETEYYVHYLNLNRRNDEWIKIDKLDQDYTPHFPEAKLDINALDKTGQGMGKGARPVEGEEVLPRYVATPRNIDKIWFGDHIIESWYYSPFYNDLLNEKGFSPMLYICDICLEPFGCERSYRRHMSNCLITNPPGDEIYRQDGVSMFEVDSDKENLYCEYLSLLSKLFLDHKSVTYSVGDFRFYVLTELKSDGFHFVGYFSKSKAMEPQKDGYVNNLSCIMVLPPFAKKGYGKLLITLSYELSKKEQIIGGPERPLSDLGILSYYSYWKYQLIEVLKQYESISLRQLSQMTYIQVDQVIETLQYFNIMVQRRRETVFYLPPKTVDEHDRRPPKIRVNPDNIHWTPPIYEQHRKE